MVSGGSVLLSWDYAPFIAFIAVMAILVFLDRKNIEAHGPLFIRRTSRGKGFLISAGKRLRRLWNPVGVIAVIVGFIASFFTIYSLADLLIKSAISMRPAAGVGLVLPSPVAVVAGGVIGVPLWHWLAAIILLLCVHEGLHGIMAVSQHMKIKSLGWIVLAVLPMGAFVEPDEKEVARKKPWPQLRFFAAGSFANIVLAFLVALVIAPLAINPLVTTTTGLQVFPQAGYPFAKSQELIQMTGNFSQQLSPVIILKAVNGFNVENYDQAQELFSELAIKSNQTVTLSLDVYVGNELSSMDIRLDAVENPSNKTRGYIGILYDKRSPVVVKAELLPWRGLIYFMTEMLQWIFIINLGVGMFNMLPLGPLDGKKMWDVALKRYMPRRYKAVMRVVQYLVLILLLAILVPSIASNFVG